MTGSSQIKNLFGLIGYPLSHSLSAEYFKRKFIKEEIKNSAYRLFELQNLSDIHKLLKSHTSLVGLNVTVPYKRRIINYLDSMDAVARETGAVNCLKIIRQGNEIKLEGFNTDVFGFEKSLKPLLQSFHQKALILGTGGGARAAAYALKNLRLEVLFVSRNPTEANHLRYQALNEHFLKEYLVVVNATPLGMYPAIDQCPDFPYEWITDKHLLYDLVYNPDLSVFLKNGRQKGAAIKNGMEMLRLQADRSYEIWTT